MNMAVIFIDHLTLRYMVNKPDHSGWVARWILLLEELDYTVKYKPGPLHKQADHLSRLYKEVGTVDIDDELPDLFLITIVSLWYAHIAEFLNTQTMSKAIVKNEQ